MRDRIAELITWSRTHRGRKLIRFTSVSLVSTATSQILILLIFGVAHLWGLIASTFVANALATIPSYYLNRTWTWGKKGRSHVVKEVLPFWAMSSLGIVCSFFFSLWTKRLVNDHKHWSHGFDTVLDMAVNFLAFGIFWVLKLLVFNRIFHVPSELEEVEEHLEHEEALLQGSEAVAGEFSPGS